MRSTELNSDDQTSVEAVNKQFPTTAGYMHINSAIVISNWTLASLIYFTKYIHMFLHLSKRGVGRMVWLPW